MPSSQTLSALQEKGFRTTFRGFDKNDVLAYLNALDNENRQHSAEQEEQIAQLQAQLDKMRSEQSAARACVEKLQSDLSAANQRAEAAEKAPAMTAWDAQPGCRGGRPCQIGRRARHGKPEPQ